MAFTNTNALETYDGYCGSKDLIKVNIKEKIRQGPFGTVKMWGVYIDIISTGICEKKDSWAGDTIMMSNEPTDEYATVTIMLEKICQECDTSCSKAATVGRFSSSGKGSGGLPPEYQKLRDALNGQCYDLGSGRPLPGSFRNKIGPDTIDSDTAITAITDALEELIGAGTLDNVLVDCTDIDCGCEGEIPPQVYGDLAKSHIN